MDLFDISDRKRQCFMELSNIRRFEMPKCGVYFLFSGDELIYIGQSINIFRRLNQHLKDKAFDSYGFVKAETGGPSVDRLEKDLIKEFQPRLNIQHRAGDLRESKKRLLCAIEKINEEMAFYGLK